MVPLRHAHGWSVAAATALLGPLDWPEQQPSEAAAERVQRAAPAHEDALAEVVPLPRRVHRAALTPLSTPLRAQDAAVYRVGTFALVAGNV